MKRNKPSRKNYLDQAEATLAMIIGKWYQLVMRATEIQHHCSVLHYLPVNFAHSHSQQLICALPQLNFCNLPHLSHHPNLWILSHYLRSHQVQHRLKWI